MSSFTTRSEDLKQEINLEGMGDSRVKAICQCLIAIVATLEGIEGGMNKAVREKGDK